MTEEELEKKAEDNVFEQLGFDRGFIEQELEKMKNPNNKFIVDALIQETKQAYIAGAKAMQEETLKEIIEMEKVSDYRFEENEQLKAQIEKMKNCDNCKNLFECTNRRNKEKTSNKMTMIRFSCCWELAE